MEPTPSSHHCIRCGKKEPAVKFRSPLALKCIECDEVTAEERRNYHKNYHKARGAAIKTLIEKYNDEFESLMLAERERIAAQEAEIIHAKAVLRSAAKKAGKKSVS